MNLIREYEMTIYLLERIQIFVSRIKKIFAKLFINSSKINKTLILRKSLANFTFIVVIFVERKFVIVISSKSLNKKFFTNEISKSSSNNVSLSKFSTNRKFFANFFVVFAQISF